jgi:hypothetical protein
MQYNSYERLKGIKMICGGVIHYTEFFGIKETKLCGKNQHLCVGYFDEYFDGDCSLFFYFGC